MSQALQVLTPEGRLVGGHPMASTVVTDQNTNQPKIGSDGQPRKESFVAVAIPKGGETDWKQTEWGALIVQAAQAGWPNGEFNAPDFAWKIDDGDSQIPNKRGRKPCEREGYPGHWVLKCSTGIPIKCYHAGYYEPTQQIQDQNAIKPGDYCRVLIMARANAPSQSPGVYLNPTMFELSRAGDLIVLDNGPSAAEVFGGAGGVPQQPAGAVPGQQPPATPGAAAPQPPAGGVPQPPAQPAPPQGIQPAHDFVNGPAAGGTPGAPAPQPPAGGVPQPSAQAEPKYQTANGAFTYAQLQTAGWSDQAIQSCQVVR